MILRYTEVALTALIAVWCGYIVYAAMGWRLEARLFPWVIGIPLLVFAGIHIVSSVRRVVGTEAEKELTGSYLEFSATNAAKETLRIVAWIAAFLIGIELFGMALGLGLATLAYLRLESRESWLLSGLLSGASFAYIFLLFSFGMHMNIPQGIVTRFVLNVVRSLPGL